MDHVTFTEAVERLAGKIGFALHYEDGGQANADHGNRARILAANEAAAEFFGEQLGSPEAEPARVFLGERGFDPAAAQRFGVGFAPKSFSALGRHLGGRGFSEAELADGRSVSARATAARTTVSAVGWSGRSAMSPGRPSVSARGACSTTTRGPKYLNTPETPVYHKSQVLYGLDLAKRDISRGRQVVVVEGYTDVMACHLAGVTTAVATCGTSFGVDHIKVLRRMLGDVDNAAPPARRGGVHLRPG